MVKDKEANRRLLLNQMIASKERESDDLHLEERQTQKQIESFESVMMQSFRHFQEIESEINRRSQIKDAYDETAQKQKYIASLMQRQQESLTQAYQKANLKLDDEREQFQTERDNLSWD